MTQKPTIETRHLKKLVPFPRQEHFFAPLSVHDLSALADDIKRNGLRQPIEILPDNTAGYPTNTIVRGHERRRALLANKETTADVLVRYDLADADAADIERAFLDDNLHRRQLDQLAKARVALRLFEIERGRSRRRRPDEEAEARDRVGKVIGMSGRHLARYWRVVKMSVEIQSAVSAGQLSLVLAAKIADLPPAKQEQIARRLKDGESPKAVMDALAKKKTRPAEKTDPLADFAAALSDALAALSERRDEIDWDTLTTHQAELGKAHRQIKRLLGLGDA